MECYRKSTPLYEKGMKENQECTSGDYFYHTPSVQCRRYRTPMIQFRRYRTPSIQFRRYRTPTVKMSFHLSFASEIHY